MGEQAQVGRRRRWDHSESESITSKYFRKNCLQICPKWQSSGADGIKRSNKQDVFGTEEDIGQESLTFYDVHCLANIKKLFKLTKH